MSVINQMLRDLESRRERGAGFGFIESLSLREAGGGRFSTGPLWPWAALLGSAGILLIFFWRGGGITLLDVAAVTSHGAQPVPASVGTTASPASEEPRPGQPGPDNRINRISWQPGSDNTLKLVLSLEAGPSQPVQRRALDNGEIEFVLPGIELAASLPLLDNDRRYFQHYRIGQRNGAVHLHVLAHPDVTVEWMTVENIADSRHAWVLKASVPDLSAGSEEPRAVSPAPAGPSASIQSKPAGARPAASSPVKTPSAKGQRLDEVYQRALSYLAADRIQPAIQELKKVISLKPAFHPARELLAGLYLQIGQETEAFILLNQGIVLAPEHLAFSRMYADALIRRGRLEQAMQVLSESDAYAGADAEFQALYAAVAQRSGEHDMAISRYMRALEMRSENGAWWMGLALSLEADGRVEAAAGAYQAAMDTGQLNTELTGYVQSRLDALEAPR